MQLIRDKTKEKFDNIKDEYVYDDTEKYIQQSSKLFKEVAKDMQGFLAKLFEDAIDEINISIPDNCKFAIIGMGSMSNQQMTPYSDLEFAIITEHYTPEIHQYFENLSNLVHFKVINLGETKFAASRYGVNMDHLIKQAVSFDLGGKTPLGRINKDKPYDLIGTQEWLLWYVENQDSKAEHIDKNLPNILRRVCHIYGDEELVKNYSTAVNKYLMSKDQNDDKFTYTSQAVKILLEGATELDYNFSINKITNSKLISGDLDKFGLEPGQSSGMRFDVKQEIYRIPDRFIDNLGLIYGVIGSSGIDIIDKLLDRKIINQTAADNLKFAISYATMLRLKTYDNYGQQHNTLILRENKVEIDSSTQSDFSKQLCLNPKDLQENGGLFKFYYIALSLKAELEKFCNEFDNLDQDVINKYFLENDFYSDDLMRKIYIHQRLFNHKEALKTQKALLSKIKSNPKNYTESELLDLYVTTYNTCTALSKFKESSIYIFKALKLAEQLNNFEAIAECHVALGNNYREASNFSEAIKHFNLAKTILIDISSSEYNIAILNNNICVAYIELQNWHKAEELLEKCEDYIKNNKNLKNNLLSATYFSNKGLIYSKTGQYKKAAEYYEKAGEMFLKIYSMYSPQYILFCNNISTVYDHLNDGKAIIYIQRAVDISKDFLNYDHKMYLTSILSQSHIYIKCSNYDLARKDLYKALEIAEKIYGPNNINTIVVLLQTAALNIRESDINSALYNIDKVKEAYKNIPSKDVELESTILIRLANTYMLLDKYDLALTNLQNSLILQESIVGNDNPKLLNIKLLLGATYIKCFMWEKAKDSINSALNIINKHEEILAHKMYSIHQLFARISKANGCYNDALVSLRKAKENYLNNNLESDDYIPIIMDIALIYKALGKNKESYERYQEALDFCIKIHPEPNIRTVIALLNIGSYYRYNKEYDKAEFKIIESLSMLNKIYDNEKQDLRSAIILELGHLSHNLADNKKALEYYIDAKQILDSIYGESTHPNQALVNSAIASIHLVQATQLKEKSLYQSSLKLFTESFQILQNVIDKNPNEELLECLDNIINLLADFGNHPEQLKYQLLKLAFYPKNTENNSDLIISLKTDIAKNHCRIGNIKEATNITEEVLNQIQNIRKEEDEFSATILNNIAGIYGMYLYKPEQAINLMKDALSIISTMYEPNSAEIAFKENNIGSMLLKNNLIQEAKQYIDKAHNKMAVIYNKDSTVLNSEFFEHYASSFNSLGILHMHLNNMNLAEENIKKYLDFVENYCLVNNSNVAMVLNNLSVIKIHQEDYKSASSYLARAKDLYEEIYNNNENDDCAQCILNIGAVSLKLGNYDIALKHFEESYNIYSKLYGEVHPDVANCLNGIGKTYQLKDDNPNTITYYTRALKIYQQLPNCEKDLQSSYQKLYTMYDSIQDEQNSAIYLNLMNQDDLDQIVIIGNNDNI